MDLPVWTASFHAAHPSDPSPLSLPGPWPHSVQSTFRLRSDMRALSWAAAPGVAALLTVCLPTAGSAQELTESAALARALADNPRLRAIRARPAQTAAEQQIRRLAPPPGVRGAPERA